MHEAKRDCNEIFFNSNFKLTLHVSNLVLCIDYSVSMIFIPKYSVSQIKALRVGRIIRYARAGAELIEERKFLSLRLQQLVGKNAHRGQETDAQISQPHMAVFAQ